MDVAEGFLYLIIMIELFSGLVGFIILSIIHAVMRWTRNRSVNLAILSVGMILSGVYVARGDAPMMITMSLFFSVPLAVLVPLAIPPIRDKPILTLSRIVPCYFMVWALSTLLPYVLVVSGLSMIPFIYWHTPFSNALIYVVLILVYFGIATIIYRFIDKRSSPVHPLNI